MTVEKNRTEKAAWRMDVIRTVLCRIALFTFLLQLGEAVSLNCTPARKDHLMTYSIDQEFPPDVNMASCEFSWNNDSTVLATHEGKVSSVERQGLNTLETKECFSNVVYKSHCQSKTSGRLTNFEASCITSCIKGDHLTGGKAPLDLTRTVLAVLGGLAGLVVAVVGGYFLYKYYKSKKKNQSNRTCGCTQWGGCYTNVKGLSPDSTV